VLDVPINLYKPKEDVEAAIREFKEQKIGAELLVVDTLFHSSIAELEAENERLRAGLDAHGTLQSIYRNPASPEGNRIKAAAASLPHEKPKLLSVGPPIELDRRERWRVYERWRLRKEILIETRDLPPKGWDAHLQPDTYTPPEGEDLPPVDVVTDPQSGFRILTNLLPNPDKRYGNGNSGDGSND
jgi:hypothetical protein